VKDAESGEIVHQIEGDQLPDVGMTVVGEIDWQRRHRFMRLHTCMHLLCSVLKYPVTGGSIGEDRARLDFDMTDTVDKEALERDLNALIAADHKLSASWITDEEMEENMDLVRTMSVKPPMGQGKVRLISIESVDLQPCGGTHVSHTGEIGAVRIGKVEKKGKQNRRVNVHLVD
jgi:misacylated tRNA(Ala) deacylase